MTSAKTAGSAIEPNKPSRAGFYAIINEKTGNYGDSLRQSVVKKRGTVLMQNLKCDVSVSKNSEKTT